MFQFYAGDLYEVIPEVARKSLANDVVNGNCKAKSDETTIKRQSTQSLNVSINLDCELNTEGHGRVTDFELNVTL